MTPRPSGLGHVRAVAIDLDGTMVDTAPDFHVAVNTMQAALGLPGLTLDDVVRRIGKGADHMVRAVLALHLPADQVEVTFDRARSLYAACFEAINGDHARIFPGVQEGLAVMRHSGLRLACVTNKSEALARDLLANKGLLAHFELIYGGDSLARRKPDPLPLLTVASDFGLAPDQLLAIGDSSNDAQAARAAGCPVLMVPYGYNHGLPVQTVDADGIVDTLHEAAQLLAAGRQIAGNDRKQA